MIISLLARWKWAEKKPASIDDYDKNGLTSFVCSLHRRSSQGKDPA